MIRRGLRVSWGFVRAHPVSFSISVAGSIVMAVGTVLSTVTLGWLTDDVVLPAFEGGTADRSRTTVVIAVLGVAAGRSLGVVVRRYFAGMTVFRSKDDLQLRLGDHYLELPADELRTASKGRLLAHVDSDVDVATDMLSPLPFTIGVFTLLGVSVLSLALVDWMLMAVALALMPLIAGLNQINANRAKGPAVDAREAVAAVSGVASESFDGALVVKTLGREAEELERFSAAAADLRHHSVRLGRIRAIFGAALDLLPDLGVVILVVLGAWRVGNDHISTGQLVQAVALFSILVFPLRVIGYFFGDIPPSIVAHDRVAAVLERPLAPRTGTAELPQGPLGVAVDGISVGYGDLAAVRDVTLDVAPGEVLAIVGQTGSGKSTLLTTLVDMVPIAAGEVRIAGVPVVDVHPASLATRTAIAWQEPFLLGGTVADNIEFGGRFDRGEIVAAAQAARLHETIVGLPDGYDTAIGEQGVRLSGGQRQRLALARALVRRPGLLVLDDATSAVDPVVEEQILDAVRDLGCTMIIVAHRRSTVALADRVALMSGGRMAAIGTHDELLGHPAYVALLDAYDREWATA